MVHPHANGGCPARASPLELCSPLNDSHSPERATSGRGADVRLSTEQCLELCEKLAFSNRSTRDEFPTLRLSASRQVKDGCENGQNGKGTRRDGERRAWDDRCKGEAMCKSRADLLDSTAEWQVERRYAQSDRDVIILFPDGLFFSFTTTGLCVPTVRRRGHGQGRRFGHDASVSHTVTNRHYRPPWHRVRAWARVSGRIGGNRIASMQQYSECTE